MFKTKGYREIHFIELKQLMETAKPIVLFGSKGMGLYAKKALDFLNIKTACFCDNSKDRQGTEIDGVPVVSPEFLQQNYPGAKIFICAFKDHYVEQIRLQLENLGFTDIHDKDLLYHIYLTKISKRFYLSKDISNLMEILTTPKDRFILNHVNASVTTKCTLKCRDCQSLMPYFRHPENLNKDVIITGVKRLAESVDAIEEIFLFGGEPLMHPDLPEICEEIADIKNILRLNIVTNGTLLPSEKLLKTMEAYGFELVMSDYGKLSTKKEQLKKLAESNNIAFLMSSESDLWVDMGDISLKNNTYEEMSTRFKNCLDSPTACYLLMDGEFHICSRSSFGTMLGAIPKNEGDYVNVLKGGKSPLDIREKLQKLLEDTPCITACNYCDITLKTVPPAIQI